VNTSLVKSLKLQYLGKEVARAKFTVNFKDDVNLHRVWAAAAVAQSLEGFCTVSTESCNLRLVARWFIQY
jgi:hypothetical protein